MRRFWPWWVGIWDRREVPWSLALVRIGVATMLLVDLLAFARLDLVELLWVGVEHDGFSTGTTQKVVPIVFRLFEPDVGTAWMLWGACVLGCLGSALGVFTRASLLWLVFWYSQTAGVMDPADRGIDTMIRNVVLLLAFSPTGKVLSVDARVRTGSWFGDGQAEPNWTRYLLILQLVAMYWLAGIQKLAGSWTPFGGYHALYYILLEPHVARAPFPWVHSIIPALQVGTAITHIWEWTAPAILLAYVYRDTRSRPGRLREFFNSKGVLWWFVAVGAFFHLAIAATLRLGIFSWVMLSLYPVWWHADELTAFARRLRRR